MTDNERIIELLTEIRDSLKKPEPKKRFVVPQVVDITMYCTERNNNIDSLVFFDHYQSKNWMIGKNKMKDWKAAVRTWEKRNGSNGQGQNNGFDKRSRAQKVSDKCDELAAKAIANGEAV